jgi:ribosomal protein L29
MNRNIKELLYEIEEKKKELHSLKEQLLTKRWLQAIEQATMVYD